MRWIGIVSDIVSIAFYISVIIWIIRRWKK